MIRRYTVDTHTVRIMTIASDTHCCAYLHNITHYDTESYL